MNDKILHFITGLGFSIIGALSWHLSGSSVELLLWFSLLAAGTAGLTKEVSDYMYNRITNMHGVEFMDFFHFTGWHIPIAVIAII